MVTWVALPGYGNRYEVSDAGAVRLVDGRAVSHRPDTDGYRIVSLRANGRYHTEKIHRLVLLAFVGPASAERPVADHVNRDRADNRLANLRWVSYSENGMNRPTRNSVGLRGVCFRNCKLRPWQVYRIVARRFVNVGHFDNLLDAAAAAITSGAARA